MSDRVFQLMTTDDDTVVTQTPRRSSAIVDVPVRMISSGTHAGVPQPVTGGICLPQGHMHAVKSALLVNEDDQAVPAQVDVLNRWADGSIRWLLAAAVVNPATHEQSVLRLQSISLANVPSDDCVMTVARIVDNRLIVQRSNRSESSVSDLELIPEWILADGTPANLRSLVIVPEIQGTVRSVFRVETSLRSDSRISLQLRLEIWPATNLVRVHVRPRNARRARHRGGVWDLGDPGSFLFSALQVTIARSDRDDAVIQWKPELHSAVRKMDHGCLRITQHGSGGRAWSCTNHVTASGQRVKNRGYDATSPAGTLRGYRATPVVSMVSREETVSVIVPEFWQKFPTGFSAADGRITVSLFPDGMAEPHELQGGEQSTQSFWLAMNAEYTQRHVDSLAEDCRVLPTAEWVEKCQVIDWFSAGETGAATDRYRRYLHDASSGDHHLNARRESIDEYGWRNYGDIPADHEQTHYAGANTVISHYNNQYDQVFGAILNLLMSGDHRWWQWSDPLARHVMDIDIYHTTEDRAAFNGGLFWHSDHYVDARTATHRTYSAQNANADDSCGGGPSNEHNYTTGLLHYYFLTGNPEAAESVRSLANWVVAMDDGSRTELALFDAGPTGRASSTVDENYHGPGRGAGNSINALLDAWILTSEDRYLEKAEQLMRRVVHPEQDLDDLNLLHSETHWSYTVCLTALGRYLGEMNRAGRRGTNYGYARAVLCHYGRWMAEHERPALSDPDNLEYVTVAWAAQDFRKANVLRIAATCCDDPCDVNRMRERANELNDAAWRDLHLFGETHLTARCLAILMTEGLRDVVHRGDRVPSMPPATEARGSGADDAPWTMFVSQKERVKSGLRSPGRVLRTMACVLHPGRWIRATDALKRRF